MTPVGRQNQALAACQLLHLVPTLLRGHSARAAFERALAILVKFLPPGHRTIRIVQNNVSRLP